MENKSQEAAAEELFSKHFNGLHHDDVTPERVKKYAIDFANIQKNSPNEEAITEAKSGMYGEMPVIKIGKYTIAEMSDEENCSTVWIEDTTDGEGGQFSKEALLITLDAHYKAHF